MSPLFNKFYCYECKEYCRLVKKGEEIYPGDFTTLIVSDCCDAPVVDALDKPYPQGMLKYEYETQESYSVDD